MLRLGILASHQGSNFQTIADACAEGSLNAQVVALICNNSDAPVMERAASMQIPAYHLSTSTHSEASALDAAIHKHLSCAQVQLVVLAGYMKKLGPIVLGDFAGRIINVHPIWATIFRSIIDQHNFTWNILLLNSSEARLQVMSPIIINDDHRHIRWH